MATQQIASVTFHERLAEFLALDGAPNQRQLAERSKVHFVHLNRIFNRKFIPGMDIAERLANGMGTTLEEFLSDDFDVSSLIPWHPKKIKRIA